MDTHLAGKVNDSALKISRAGIGGCRPGFRMYRAKSKSQFNKSPLLDNVTNQNKASFLGDVAIMNKNGTFIDSARGYKEI